MRFLFTDQIAEATMTTLKQVKRIYGTVFEKLKMKTFRRGSKPL